MFFGNLLVIMGSKGARGLIHQSDDVKPVAIATNTGVVAFERVSAFEEVFNMRKIEITKKVMFDEYADANAMQQSGLLNELSHHARGNAFKNLLHIVYVSVPFHYAGDDEVELSRRDTCNG
ncbi:hypothetical protein OSTOST_16072 [Ostertagia ostertagi]